MVWTSIQQTVGLVVLGLGLSLGAMSAMGEEAKAPLPAGVESTKVKVPLCLADTEFVKLPAGKVTIKDAEGKEKTAEVKPIWISRTEITWDLYEIYYMGKDLPEKEAQKQIAEKTRPSKPYENPERGWGKEGCPIGSIHLIEAKRFCEWMEKQIPGKKFRLPTDAEWEYACRAGGAAVKPSAKDLEAVAWFSNNSDEKTHHVAEKKPNAWGLYDMLGNVAEWVIREDGVGVLAGGSFMDEAEDVSSAAREEYKSKWQTKDPQEPKSKCWLSNGAFAGVRLVMEDK